MINSLSVQSSRRFSLSPYKEALTPAKMLLGVCGAIRSPIDLQILKLVTSGRQSQLDHHCDTIWSTAKLGVEMVSLSGICKSSQHLAMVLMLGADKRINLVCYQCIYLSSLALTVLPIKML